MAPQTNPSPRPHQHQKLPRLEPGTKIQKRPLPRRQQPPSSNAHIVYVSSRGPFMSAVTRVRKLLDRSLQGRAPSTKGRSLAQRVALLSRVDGTAGAEGRCEVLVLGTGRAIEKTLSVAGWFMAQGDCDVQVRTKTVGTVDDIVEGGDEGEGDGFEEESRVRRVSCLEVVVTLK